MGIVARPARLVKVSSLGAGRQDLSGVRALTETVMYPHVFRPTTLCSLSDDRGHTVTGCDAQILRPLLGCSFNGPQDLIVGHSIPNKAGVVLRGLVAVSASSPLDVSPGPAYWGTGLVPYVVLSEDPHALRWRWLDAVPWLLPDTRRLWSFVAAVGPVPPPPPPPTPITPGATPATGAPIGPGVDYVFTLPPGGTAWVWWGRATGAPYTIIVSPASSLVVVVTPNGGAHLGFVIVEGVAQTGPGTVSVPGGAHVGPDALAMWFNPGLLPAVILFRVT